MKKWGLLLAATLLVGCTGTSPVATPIPTATTPAQATAPAPTPTPVTATPTSAPIPPTATAVITVVPTPTPPPIDDSNIRCAAASDTAGAEFDDVIDQLGFAFKPSMLPDGFEFADLSRNQNSDSFRQIYQNAGYYLIITYPEEFSPDAAPNALEWVRPDDAVSDLRLGDQTAYIMTGGWSDASIIIGPGTKNPIWDYTRSLALFFTCRTDDGRDVDIAIRALPGPIDWISAREIVDVAQSLRRISRSQ